MFGFVVCRSTNVILTRVGLPPQLEHCLRAVEGGCFLLIRQDVFLTNSTARGTSVLLKP